MRPDCTVDRVISPGTPIEKGKSASTPLATQQGEEDMATNGIEAILTVVETRSNDANEEALLKANSARENIAKQKQLRQASRDFEEIARSDNDGNGTAEISSAEMTEIRNLLSDSGLNSGGLTRMGSGDIGVTGDAQDNSRMIENARGRFQDAIKDLEADDKMGNFEIQDLLSRSNQAETLRSSIRKKLDDTAGAQIGNVR
jgi:hypothetical protein